MFFAAWCRAGGGDVEISGNRKNQTFLKHPNQNQITKMKIHTKLILVAASLAVVAPLQAQVGRQNIPPAPGPGMKLISWGADDEQTYLVNVRILQHYRGGMTTAESAPYIKTRAFLGTFGDAEYVGGERYLLCIFGPESAWFIPGGAPLPQPQPQIGAATFAPAYISVSNNSAVTVTGSSWIAANSWSGTLRFTGANRVTTNVLDNNGQPHGDLNGTATVSNGIVVAIAWDNGHTWRMR